MLEIIFIFLTNFLTPEVSPDKDFNTIQNITYQDVSTVNYFVILIKIAKAHMAKHRLLYELLKGLSK